MSKAFRCDACKTCFDPYKVKGEFVSINRVVYQSAEDFARHEFAYFDEELNLCPSCSRIFSLFMSGKPLVEKQLMDSLQEDMDATLEEKKDEKTIDFKPISDCIRHAAHFIDKHRDELLRRLTGNDPVCEDKTSERAGDSKQESID